MMFPAQSRTLGCGATSGMRNGTMRTAPQTDIAAVCAWLAGGFAGLAVLAVLVFGWFEPIDSKHPIPESTTRMP
jgi:hypothetical protein